MTASAIDFQGAGALTVHIATTSQSVAYSTGWAANDYSLLCVYLETTATITTPTGWTALGHQDFSGTNRRLAVFGRLLQAGDTGSVTVTWATSSTMYGQIVNYRGVNATTPVEGGATAAGGAILAGIGFGFTWPSPTAGVTRQVAFMANRNTGGFPGVLSPTLAAGGDALYAQIEQAFDNGASGSSSFSCYHISHTVGAGEEGYKGDAAFQWFGSSTPSQDGGYIIVTLLPADGTLAPLTTNGAQVAYSTGQYRPLLAQAALHSAGRTFSADSTLRMVVQVADTTNSATRRWLDVTDRLRAVGDCSRGCEQPADRPRVGALGITLDNLDGLLSPWATSGAFTTSGVSFMRAGTLLRVGFLALSNSSGFLTDGWYPAFTGRIEDVAEGTTDNRDAWVTYSVTELTAEAAADNRAAIAAAGASETPDLRIFRILDGEWFYGVDLSNYSDTAIGDSIALSATTLEGNALNELYLMADSTYRRVLGGSDGAIWLTRLYPPTGLTAAFTFSNDPVTYSCYPAANIVPYASRDRILNRIRGTRSAGGSSMQRGDATSVRKYGVRAEGYGFPRTDLQMVNSTDLDTVLTAWATRHAFDELGIGSIDVDADMSFGMWSVLVYLFSRGLEGQSVVEVKWKHPAGGLFDFVAVLNGFSWSFVSQGPNVPGKLTGTLQLEAYTAATA
jgi:hypothetical protein